MCTLIKCSSSSLLVLLYAFCCCRTQVCKCYLLVCDFIGGDISERNIIIVENLLHLLLDFRYVLVVSVTGIFTYSKSSVCSLA